MKLDESVAAIVTGGASGLGEATARMLAVAGAKVALFDMNAARVIAALRDPVMARTRPERRAGVTDRRAPSSPS